MNPDNIGVALLFLLAAAIGSVAVVLGFRLVRDIRSTQRELARLQEERTKVKHQTMMLSAIKACPIKSLEPSHYRDDSTCLCTVKLPELSDEELRTMAEESLASRPSTWPAIDDREAWVDAFVEAGRILSGRVIGR